MKTKLTLVALLILVAIGKMNAQDVLLLKNGEEQKVKVLEVNTNDIKYKKWDNQNGPAYSILKSELFMVKYENGSKDVFKDAVAPSPPPQNNNNNSGYNNNNNGGNNGYNGGNGGKDTHKQVQDELNNYKAQQEVDKNNRLFRSRLGSGIAMTAIGAPFLIVGLSLIGVGATYASYDNSSSYSYGSPYYSNAYGSESYLPLLISGGVLAIVGIPLTIVGPIKIATAMKYKRKAREAKASMSFEPVLHPNSLGGGNRAMGGITTGMGIKIKF